MRVERMSNIATPPPAAEPPTDQGKPPRTLSQKLSQWFIAIALLISGGFGILKGVDQFMLPSCGSDRTTKTLKSIFKGKNIEMSDLTDVKTLTDTYSEKTCQAHVTTPGEQANIDYRIYWDGWSASIIITKVN
jgi:hypothetical protein